MQVIKPNNYTIEDLKVDQKWQEKIKMTEEMVNSFIKLTGDCALSHVDNAHAVKMGFERCILHGFLVSSGYSRILGMFLPGCNTVIHKVQIDMIAPVLVGDIITYEVKIDKISPAVKAVHLKLSAVNQKGVLVNKGSAVCVFRL